MDSCFRKIGCSFDNIGGNYISIWFSASCVPSGHNSGGVRLLFISKATSRRASKRKNF